VAGDAALGAARARRGRRKQLKIKELPQFCARIPSREAHPARPGIQANR
jgi:hypothetical protein